MVAGSKVVVSRKCAYQVADNHLVAIDNSQVKWRHLRGVTNTRVDVDGHREKKQNCLKIAFLDLNVQEVVAFGIKLCHIHSASIDSTTTFNRYLELHFLAYILSPHHLKFSLTCVLSG